MTEFNGIYTLRYLGEMKDRYTYLLDVGHIVQIYKKVMKIEHPEDVLSIEFRTKAKIKPHFNIYNISRQNITIHYIYMEESEVQLNFVEMPFMQNLGRIKRRK